MTNEQQNSLPLYRRFFIYQKERFPILGHGLLIAAFSFSAISYSRICRGAEGFVSAKTYAAGLFSAFTFFFLLRVSDEFKDAEDDAKYRKYLPVPRGLISFRELRLFAIITIALQVICTIFFFPSMFSLYMLVGVYLFLMFREFFVEAWLRKRQIFYVVSHMAIIPLVDIYTSGFDWHLQGASAPKGLLYFFGVSYLNGVVLEFGRKIRPKENEEEGVVSYSAMYGADKATKIWLVILAATYLFSLAAAEYAGYGISAIIILSSFLVICAIPGFMFLNNKTRKLSKMIEYSSGIWTIAMYLTLGGIPMLIKLLF